MFSAMHIIDKDTREIKEKIVYSNNCMIRHILGPNRDCLVHWIMLDGPTFRLDWSLYFVEVNNWDKPKLLYLNNDLVKEPSVKLKEIHEWFYDTTGNMDGIEGTFDANTLYIKDLTFPMELYFRIIKEIKRRQKCNS